LQSVNAAAFLKFDAAPASRDHSPRKQSIFIGTNVYKNTEILARHHDTMDLLPQMKIL